MNGFQTGPELKGLRPNMEIFLPPGKMCWT